MVCNKVVIISRGTVVAVDTPDALTRRLIGADRVAVAVRGPAEAVKSRLQDVPGVLSVSPSPTSNGILHFEVDAEPGHDIREQVAAAVVEGGWGLQELRSQGLSLEEIFLQLTTSEEGVPVA
jgi:ABC-2 type transport system ATP-binding protein